MIREYAGRRAVSSSGVWLALLVLLLALRLPSLAQPAGGDQGLYLYAGQRILAGEVMYRDMWDQKPPAVAFLYGALWSLWPHESLVPAADLLAAAAVAALLVVLGRRGYSTTAGYAAAALFLLFGDPYLQRLSGIYVRGQCEPFIALAITAALVLASGAQRRPPHLVAAGVLLAAAFWFKYNAAAYALPVVVAAWFPPGEGRTDARRALRALAWIAVGSAGTAALVLGYFAMQGALLDLRLATLDYNLRYSNETYDSPFGFAGYVLAMPFERARVDMLWFLGGLGTLLLAGRLRTRPFALITLAWVLAAVLSIAINGSRGLPNYFVQANPALALAAGAGLTGLRVRGPWLRTGVAALLVLALWRVGADEPVGGWRLGSLPGMVQNIRYDLAHLRGWTDRHTYLSRFRGQKHDALENERLAAYMRQATSPAQSTFVFGFSGGSVGWKSERRSASRFYWSRPLIIGFEADRPGYGSSGLLEDLRRDPPAVVALQREEWGSEDFFLSHPALRHWIESGYVRAWESPMFSVWTPKGAGSRRSDQSWSRNRVKSSMTASSRYGSSSRWTAGSWSRRSTARPMADLEWRRSKIR